MTTTDIRLPAKQFLDRQHFPYGFRKSGDFSIAEADVLSTYGKTLADLESGQIAPDNAEERHFIAVLKGDKQASSLFEKTWLKYIKLARNRKQFYTLHSSASNQSDYDDDYTDDEFDVA